VPASALVTHDAREQMDQDVGSWRLLAALLALGGLLVGGMTLAIAYAAAGAVGGGILLALGLALGWMVGSDLLATPAEFQRPYLSLTTELPAALLAASGLLALVYGLAVVPRRHTRAGALLRWAARQDDTLLVASL